VFLKYLILLLGFLGLTSCSPRVQRLSDGLTSLSQQDPAVSGDGSKLALIVDKNGRPSVQLRDIRNSKTLPLRYLSRHQPHSSPSLSWNGRYLAVIVQRGTKRVAIVEDRISGKIHRINIPGDRLPLRLSLAPDGGQLALQYSEQGKWRIKLFDLSKIIEPDLSPELRLSSPALDNAR